MPIELINIEEIQIERKLRNIIPIEYINIERTRNNFDYSRISTNDRNKLNIILSTHNRLSIEYYYYHLNKKYHSLLLLLKYSILSRKLIRYQYYDEFNDL